MHAIPIFALFKNLRVYYGQINSLHLASECKTGEKFALSLETPIVSLIL